GRRRLRPGRRRQGRGPPLPASGGGHDRRGVAARLRHRRHGRRREARRGAGRGAARHGGPRRPSEKRWIGSSEMTPTPNPGRVAFVGSGPGDPGLLTVRAREALASAPLVITDSDVPDQVLALVADGAEVRPAVGAPNDVAKELVNEVQSGRSVTRLVSGYPFATDSVVQGAIAVAAAKVPFDVVPGGPAGTAVPTYAGVPLGAAHVEADVRAGVDWPRLAAAPGTFVLHATAANLAEMSSSLTEHGVPAQTPVAVTVNGTRTTQKPVQSTLATRATDAAELEGPLVVTVGAEVGLRAELSWWESRALYGWRVLVPRTKDQARAKTAPPATPGATAGAVSPLALRPH